MMAPLIRLPSAVPANSRGKMLAAAFPLICLTVPVIVTGAVVGMKVWFYPLTPTTGRFTLANWSR